MTGGLSTRLVTSAGNLDGYIEAWDRLAVESGRPYSAPAWMLSWWRHAAPRRAELRTVLVFDGDRLACVAPFYALRRAGLADYELLAATTSAGIEPLARPGLEEECARAICACLATVAPRPSTLRLRRVPAASRWPQLLRTHWGGPSWQPTWTEDPVRAPFLERDERSFDEYLSSLSSNFRGQLRRHRRALRDEGMSERVVEGGPESERYLARFAELHHQRWRDRGGSAALGPQIERMLEQVAGLADAGRLRLAALDVGDRSISVQVLVAAGGTVAYWLGGFDDRWAHRKPGYVALLVAIEDFFRRGEETMDLGPGGQPYKYRFAERDRVLTDVVMTTRPAHTPLALAARSARWLRVHRPRGLRGGAAVRGRSADRPG